MSVDNFFFDIGALTNYVASYGDALWFVGEADAQSATAQEAFNYVEQARNS